MMDAAMARIRLVCRARSVTPAIGRSILSTMVLGAQLADHGRGHRATVGATARMSPARGRLLRD